MPFTRNLFNKYGKQLLDTATEIGIDALKTATKKVTPKAAEAAGELIGKNMVDKIVKPKPVPNMNLRNVGEIVIPPEKREEILNKLRQLL